MIEPSEALRALRAEHEAVKYFLTVRHGSMSLLVAESLGIRDTARIAEKNVIAAAADEAVVTAHAAVEALGRAEGEDTKPMDWAPPLVAQGTVSARLTPAPHPYVPGEPERRVFRQSGAYWVGYWSGDEVDRILRALAAARAGGLEEGTK